MDFLDNQTLSDIRIQNDSTENAEYTDCIFNNCKFDGVKFVNYSFIECKFYNCVFRNVKFEQSEMRSCSFYDSLLMGINWNELIINRGKSLSLFPIETISNCVLRYSSFFQYSLAKMNFDGSTFEDCIFQECDLSKSTFKYAIFKKSSFSKCDLTCADFRDANGYSIDINTNKLKQARFSYPDVVNLLYSLDIRIE
jgi:uncharacterized protein YjbI with pentapeptide repeats